MQIWCGLTSEHEITLFCLLPDDDINGCSKLSGFRKLNCLILTGCQWFLWQFSDEFLVCIYWCC